MVKDKFTWLYKVVQDLVDVPATRYLTPVSARDSKDQICT